MPLGEGLLLVFGRIGGTEWAAVKMHGVQCEFSPLRLNREQSGQTRQGFRRIHNQITPTLLSDRKEQGLVMAKESDVITCPSINNN